jgi:hypothetical protein
MEAILAVNASREKQDKLEVFMAENLIFRYNQGVLAPLGVLYYQKGSKLLCHQLNTPLPFWAPLAWWEPI